MGESALDQRGIEHHKFDVAPLWVRGVVPPHDTHNSLEFISVGPELPIKGHFRQFGLPFGRGVERIAVPTEHCLSVPIATNTIEFLAHEPASRVVLRRVVVVRQHYVDAASVRGIDPGSLVDQLVDCLLIVTNLVFACNPRRCSLR